MERHLGTWNKPLNRVKALMISDVTLREGEQTPGVTFTLEEKKDLVRLLDSVGVGQMQIGHPRLNPRALAVCRELCAVERRLQMEIMSNGMLDGVYEIIDAADSCGPEVLHSYFMASPYQYAAWSTDTRKDMLRKMGTVVEHIKKKGKIANISLLDGTRAPDKKYLAEQIETACKAGADRVRLPDTVGVADPDGYYAVVSMGAEIADKYGAIIGIHTHNDFGLALANTLAGIRAGAGLVDVTVNGLGDRAGNVCLAQLVVLLNGFYNKDCGVDMTRMTEVSRFVERIAGVKLPGNQPLVGEHVFSDAAELHVLGMRDSPFAYQGLSPKELGAARKIIFGKLTSEKIIDLVAERKKRPIAKEHYAAIQGALHDIDSANKGLVLTEDHFWTIVGAVEDGRTPDIGV